MPAEIIIPIEKINDTYQFSLILNNNTIAKDQLFSEDSTSFLFTLNKEFRTIFNRPYLPTLDPGIQLKYGSHLFEILLKDHWEAIKNAAGTSDHIRITISSKESEILNIPWELMTPDNTNFIGTETRLSISRYPGITITHSSCSLRPGPLRLLLMACSPRGTNPLLYEREEEYTLKGIHGLPVEFDSGDLGTFEELETKIRQFRPHIVHLTGYGVIGDDNIGRFAFEDEGGNLDLKSSDEIRHILVDQGVQCVFVSGCQSGEAPPVDAIKGICQTLVSEQVPAVIGWAASIADSHATTFARNLYKELAAGTSLDQSLNLARWKLWNATKDTGDLSWVLPVLYTSSSQCHLFEPGKPEVKEKVSNLVRPLPGMTEGYAPHFVGRRRELQKVLPGLQSGEYSVIILTGMGGAGKSALATKIARKFENSMDYTPVAIPCSREAPLTCEMLIERFAVVFGSPLTELLRQKDLSPSQKLSHIFHKLNQEPYVLVIDNFETNLDDSNIIADPDIATFYTMLLSELSGKSRVIITCRYLPAGVKYPTTAFECQLGDLNQADVGKVFRNNEQYEVLTLDGRIPDEMVSEVYRVFGGVPRFLEQILSLLNEDPAQFLEDLRKISLPSGDDNPNELRELRDTYYDSLVLSRLYKHLESDASRVTLCQSAVYSIAIPPEVIAAVTSLPVRTIKRYIQEWQNRAFIFTDHELGVDNLWAVYGMLRPWLLDHLGDDERVSACNTAGDFLWDLEKDDREKYLGISWISCLLEARSLFLQAEELEKARLVTGRLSDFFVRRGMYDSVRVLNRELLQREVHPYTLNWLGKADYDQGCYERARLIYEQSLTICMEIGDRVGEARMLHNLASIDVEQCCYKHACDLFEQSLAIYKEIGNRRGEASSLHQLAIINLHLCFYEKSRVLLEQVLEISNDIGDRIGEASSLHTLASIDLCQGLYERASDLFERVLNMRNDIGDRAGEASTLHNLASIDLCQGSYERARDLFKQALDIRMEIGDRTGEANTLYALASIDLFQGRYERARVLNEQSLIISKDIGNCAGEASNLYALASIDLRQGRYEHARVLYEQSLVISNDIGNSVGEASSLHQLGIIDLRQGFYEHARSLFSQALTLCESLQSVGNMAEELYSLGVVASHLDHPIGALKLIGLSVHLYQSVNHRNTKIALTTFEQVSSGYSPEQVQELIEQTVEKFKTEGATSVVDLAFTDHQATGLK
ncbi:MAG TPA: tetratricopeptide repeat protein [Methanospirillum sp.]|uniref:tetratricopeptide repeat protein n=1 Tax=Methanospirillum sp. TaxID=45200 RepID=UPI002C8784CC|nr:tetratricopeptide repeat protein [Methanospirillum sp.]HWQ63055.1 tetratricopeptide repeat protein [Methanospirillum sp.]